MFGLDWQNVLEVAKENAARQQLADRYHTIPGDALQVDLGRDYDLVLIPNFIHHLDASTCVAFLQRVHAALKPGGEAVIVEFIPNDDRVTPPEAATFALTMLAGTPGDAYTYREIAGMLRSAGFRSTSLHDLPTPTHRIVLGGK